MPMDKELVARVAETIREILQGNFPAGYEGDQARHQAIVEAGFCKNCGIDVKNEETGELRWCHCENDD